MQNKFKDFMEEWEFNDEILIKHREGDTNALKDRYYQKSKLKDTEAFLRINSGKRLNREEKARRIILETSRRQLEKKLYPNRFMRYARRMAGTIGRAGRRWVIRLNRVNEPTPDFMTYPHEQQKKQPGKKEQIKEVVKATVLKLPVKNKYAAAKGAKQSKGRSL